MKLSRTVTTLAFLGAVAISPVAARGTEKDKGSHRLYLSIRIARKETRRFPCLILQSIRMIISLP